MKITFTFSLQSPLQKYLQWSETILKHQESSMAIATKDVTNAMHSILR